MAELPVTGSTVTRENGKHDVASEGRFSPEELDGRYERDVFGDITNVVVAIPPKVRSTSALVHAQARYLARVRDRVPAHDEEPQLVFG